MDMITLAMLNGLKKSGGAGYTEKKSMTYDGNPDGKVQVPSDVEGFALVKISDEICDISAVTKVHLSCCGKNGETYTFTDMLSANNDYGAHIGPMYDNPALFWFPGQLSHGGGGVGTAFPEGTIMAMCIPEVFPEDELEKGTYVLSGYIDDGVFTGYWYISLIETETIHPIDPKFLPGVCLPVVELGTLSGDVTAGISLRDAGSKALTEVAATGLPIIAKFAHEQDGTAFRYSMLFNLNEIGETVAYMATNEGMTYCLMGENGVWVFIAAV